LGCDDYPSASPADRSEFFGDRLKVKHQMGISTDELAHFVDEKNDTVVWAFGVEIVLDPLAEVLHGH